MATKLGPVQIPITLDITTAERKLDELEVKVGKVGAGGRSASPSMGSREISTSGPNVEDKRRQKLLNQLKRYYEMNSAEKWQFRMEEKAAQQAMWARTHSKFGMGAGIQSWRNTLNTGGVGALAARAMSALRVPGQAAIAYGIASSTAKFLPEAYSLGQRLAGESMSGQITGSPGDLMKEIPQLIEHLRQQFVNLETKVMGIVSGLQKTISLNEAAMRLTGKLPNSKYYYAMMHMTDVQDARVKAKFDTWKRREAPAATAQTLVDLFSRSLFR